MNNAVFGSKEFLENFKKVLGDIATTATGALKNVATEHAHVLVDEFARSLSKAMEEDAIKRARFLYLLSGRGVQEPYSPVLRTSSLNHIVLEKATWAMITSNPDQPHNAREVGYSLQDSIVWLRFREYSTTNHGSVINVNFTLTWEDTLSLLNDCVNHLE